MLFDPSKEYFYAPTCFIDRYDMFSRYVQQVRYNSNLMTMVILKKHDTMSFFGSTLFGAQSACDVTRDTEAFYGLALQRMRRHQSHVFFDTYHEILALLRIGIESLNLPVSAIFYDDKIRIGKLFTDRPVMLGSLRFDDFRRHVGHHIVSYVKFDS